jgi:hypothetical protein
VARRASVGDRTVRRGIAEGALPRAVGPEQEVRAEAEAAGLIGHDQAGTLLSQPDDPRLAISSPIMLTAWGRRAAYATLQGALQSTSVERRERVGPCLESGEP